MRRFYDAFAAQSFLYDLFCYLLACCTRVDTNIYGRFYYTYGALLPFKGIDLFCWGVKTAFGFLGELYNYIHCLSFFVLVRYILVCRSRVHLRKKVRLGCNLGERKQRRGRKERMFCLTAAFLDSDTDH